MLALGGFVLMCVAWFRLDGFLAGPPLPDRETVSPDGEKRLASGADQQLRAIAVATALAPLVGLVGAIPLLWLLIRAVDRFVPELGGVDLVGAAGLIVFSSVASMTSVCAALLWLQSRRAGQLVAASGGLSRGDIHSVRLGRSAMLGMLALPIASICVYVSF